MRKKTLHNDLTWFSGWEESSIMLEVTFKGQTPIKKKIKL